MMSGEDFCDATWLSRLDSKSSFSFAQLHSFTENYKVFKVRTSTLCFVSNSRVVLIKTFSRYENLKNTNLFLTLSDYTPCG